jgi:D-arabinose 1-dehydrogenase-like Zn-dependent alcohol dehydrogenase
MKVVRFHAPGDVRVEDSPEPIPGPGEVKLQVRNCSTCGTDVKIFRFGHHHIVPPRVMGHEIAGEVVAVGDGVSGWSAATGCRSSRPSPVDTARTAGPGAERSRTRRRWVTTTTAASPNS